MVGVARLASSFFFKILHHWKCVKLNASEISYSRTSGLKLIIMIKFCESLFFKRDNGMYALGRQCQASKCQHELKILKIFKNHPLYNFRILFLNSYKSLSPYKLLKKSFLKQFCALFSNFSTFHPLAHQIKILKTVMKLQLLSISSPHKIFFFT